MNRCASALVIAAAILLIAAPAVAAAPPLTAQESTPGGSLRPAGESTVGVIEEHLLLDLREPEGRIRASYRLRNLSAEPVDLSIAFPVPPWVMGEWKVAVTLDGRAFPVGLALGPVVLKEGETDLVPSWRDPFSGQFYLPRKSREPVGPQNLLFGVAFNPGQERELAVEYWQFPGRDSSRFLAPVRRYDHLLQPARHWASFGDLTIEVLAPPGVPVKSVPPLQSLGGGRYAATLEGLPPENLSVYVAPGAGPRWWWVRTSRGWFLAAFAAVTGVLAGLASLSGWPRVRRAGVPFSLLTWALLYVLAPPYLLREDPTGVTFLWLLMIPSLMVLHILCRSLVRWIAGKAVRARE